MKRFFGTVCLAGCLAGSGGLLWAADAPTNQPADKPAEQQKAPRPKFRSYRGTVKAFDKTTMTLTVEGEKTDTVYLTPQTRVWKEGQSTNLDAIVAGEIVRGGARETSEGRWEALSVYLGKPVLRKAPPAEKGDQKKEGQPEGK